MKRGHRIDRVGRAASASEGTLVVWGESLFGVVDAKGRLVFAPPSSVALVWAADRLWSWRVERREGTSGVGRGDLLWRLERYRLGDADGVLEWSHTIETSTEIGVADHLVFVPRTGQRIVELAYAAEDSPGAIFVVLKEDGTVVEVADDRVRALAILKGEDGSAKDASIAPTSRVVTTPRDEGGPLDALVADPDDDAARRRYAAHLGGERGALIARSLDRAQAAAHRELLKSKGAAWAAAEMGLMKTGLAWDRGFVVRGTIGRANEQQRSHPHWRMFREVPANMELPLAERMDSLARLGCFNTASWLEERARPWSKLAWLMARRAELELLVARPEHVPALRELSVFLERGEPSLDRLPARPLAQLELFGDVRLDDVPDHLARIESRGDVAELVLTEGHGQSGHVRWVAHERGRFRRVVADAKVTPSHFLALLARVGRRDHVAVEHPSIAPSELTPWCASR
ncbi:MAG: hypothetical protein J0L92_12980 [Deltaproteobacteria bacterium]|nr:hypothetical protein [Deltaproteobacteria bacterium]